MKGKTVIKLQGKIDSQWAECFEGMTISYTDKLTILTGIIKDESHLHGILNQLRDLNIVLVSLNPIENINQ